MDTTRSSNTSMARRGGAAKDVLVAGIGNCFFCDDGFGVEVARELASRPVATQVRVADFGIQGLHLMLALLEPPDLLVLVHVAPRGGAPGTLYLIDGETDGPTRDARSDGPSMDLGGLFEMLAEMGVAPAKTLVVACEPGDLSAGVELSGAVRKAVPRALEMVERIVERELGGAEWLKSGKSFS
jgi:hydrogenase maturation protease